MANSPIPFIDARAPNMIMWDHVRGCDCACCAGTWDDGLMGIITIEDFKGNGYCKNYGRSFPREMAIDRVVGWHMGTIPLPPKDWMTEEREKLNRELGYV